jgi:hypothetical protein
VGAARGSEVVERGLGWSEKKRETLRRCQLSRCSIESKGRTHLQRLRQTAFLSAEASSGNGNLPLLSRLLLTSDRLSPHCRLSRLPPSRPMRQLLPSEVLREQRLLLQCGAKGRSGDEGDAVLAGIEGSGRSEVR